MGGWAGSMKRIPRACAASGDDFIVQESAITCAARQLRFPLDLAGVTVVDLAPVENDGLHLFTEALAGHQVIAYFLPERRLVLLPRRPEFSLRHSQHSQCPYQKSALTYPHPRAAPGLSL